MCKQIVFDGLHSLARQRSSVFYGLLAHAAESRIYGGIIRVGGLALQHSALHEKLFERRVIPWIIRLLRLLLGIEVVEVAVELVESMEGRQEFVTIAQAVLSDLRRHVA